MSTVAELLVKKVALELQIEAARKTESSDIIAKAKALIAEHGLTQQDIFGGARATRKSSVIKVAAKYKDPMSGATWSGRGRAPSWIEGQDRVYFLIL